MTYKKPRNVRYTDMAIYIDEHINQENYDVNKCFEYMYHLFMMLALKGRYFRDSADYDAYALYGASQVLMRYKKQQDPNYKRHLEPLKSVLNYIKKIAIPLKINYQQENYAEIFNDISLNSGDADTLKQDITYKVIQENNKLADVDMRYYLEQFAFTIKKEIKQGPYAHDRRVQHNLFLSIVFSFLRTLTLSNKNHNRVEVRASRKAPPEVYIKKIYKEESVDGIVLWHLPVSWHNYVNTLFNRVKRTFCEDLRFLIGANQPTEDVIKSVLLSPVMDEFEGEEDYGD